MFLTKPYKIPLSLDGKTSKKETKTTQVLALASYKWIVDRACFRLFGQDGWILAKFFFCVFMDGDGVEFYKLAKKERGQYPAILIKQAWSIKDLLYGLREIFSCGARWLVPNRQDSSILPAREANHSAGLIIIIIALIIIIIIIIIITLFESQIILAQHECRTD